MEKPGEIQRVRQQSCYICRQYTPKTMNTQWKCRHCDMPLCQVDRTELGKDRGHSCIEEQQNSDNEFLGCVLMAREAYIMPEHLKKYTMTRAMIAKKADANEKERKAKETTRAQAREQNVQWQSQEVEMEDGNHVSNKRRSPRSR